MYGPLKLRLIALGSLLLPVPLTAVAVDASYLKAIESDVEEFANGRFDNEIESRWVPDSSQRNLAGASVEQFKAFRSLLRKRMPGSYIRFAQLPGWKQTEIMNTYDETGDLKRVKREILETLP